MRFGISSYTFAWSIGVAGHPVPSPMSGMELLAEAARLGADAVQIADNLPLEKLGREMLVQLRQRADELGLGLEVGARGLRRENLSMFIQIAAQMNSPILRFVIDRGDYEPTMGAVEQLIREVLAQLEDHDLRLAIENHDRFQVAEYVTLIETLATDRVGICLDTVNSMGAGQGYETVVEALAPYTINLHVKDFTIRRVSHQMGFVVTGAPAGKGMLPMRDLISRLDSVGRCQTAVLETWPAPESSLEATLLKEREWAQSSADFLRQSLREAAMQR